ncbi:MAG: histidine phosphatase family protein [Jatrophihabitantaceae bacterium]
MGIVAVPAERSEVVSEGGGLVVVEADGGSRGNPGPAGYGAVVKDAGTGAVLAERKDAIGIATNNVAEYRGLIAGLEAARDLGAGRVAVRMDSKLVVEQLKGTWQVRSEGLRPLARAARELRSSFAEVTFEWIPRERNKHADRLANEAMDAASGKVASWAPPSGPRTRLVLVRHGATVHSHDRRFSGRNDLPLDEAGERQAAALAKRPFGDIAAIVTSPLRRARQTAEVIAAALDAPVSVEEAFAELDFGAFEGLTPGEARERYPDEMIAWRASPEAAAPPGGESFADLAHRVWRGRDAVVAHHPDATVLVVSHVSPIKILVRAALDAPPASVYHMHLDTASVSSVDYLGDGSATLRLFNDTSHLSR